MEYTLCQEEPAFASNWMGLLYFELVSSILSCILSLVSGLLVYLVAIKNPHKKLRTSLSALVITMATGALLMGIIAEPPFIYFTIATLNDVTFHPQAPFLQFAQFMSFTSSMITLFTIVGITVNRYLFVSIIGWFKLYVTFSRTLVATSMAWIISVTYPLLFFNTGLRRYCILHSTACVFFISVSLVFTFVWIRNKLKAFRDRGRMQTIIQEACVSSKHSWIMLLSLGCYVPALVMVVVAELCGNCSCMSKAWLARTCFVIARIHCTLTPVLYALSLEDYRYALRNIFFKRLAPELNVLNSIRRTDREISCFEMSKTNGIRTAKL